jgi:broad specificity phosphatase PhoE
VSKIATDHEGGLVLLVSHAGPIRAVHAAALGMTVEAYRRVRPVEPNARLSGVCFVDGRLNELCPGGRIDELIGRGIADRSRDAAAPGPTPAG